MAIQPNQPQSIGAVLDTGLRLYKASLAHVLPLSVIVALAALPGALYSLAWSARAGSNSTDVGQLLAELIRMLSDPLYWTILILGFLVQVWLYCALTLQINAIASDQSLPPKTALASALRHLPAVFLLLLIYGISMTLGSFVVIGIILSVSWLPGYLFTLLESKGPIAALRSSHQLVWGNWWRTTAILSVVFIMLMVVNAAMGMVMGIGLTIAGTQNAALTFIISGITTFVSTLIFAPLYPALVLVIYWDLKLRKHGGDLAARVGALGASA